MVLSGEGNRLCVLRASAPDALLRATRWAAEEAANALTLTLSNKRWIPCPLLLEPACLCGYLMEAAVREAAPVSWPNSSETGSFCFLFLQLLTLRAESSCEKSEDPDGQATCRVLRLHGGEEWPRGVPTSGYPPVGPRCLRKGFLNPPEKASHHPNTSTVQFSSVARSCPTLCNPMDRSTPGLPVHPQLPEFTQIPVNARGTE